MGGGAAWGLIATRTHFVRNKQSIQEVSRSSNAAITDKGTRAARGLPRGVARTGLPHIPAPPDLQLSQRVRRICARAQRSP